MLYALLFLPALVAIAYVVTRARRPVAVLAEAAPPPSANPFDSLESLLAELESATLDERDVEELERLAAELEHAVLELERVA
jgi:hypothetical protein